MKERSIQSVTVRRVKMQKEYKQVAWTNRIKFILNVVARIQTFKATPQGIFYRKNNFK